MYNISNYSYLQAKKLGVQIKNSSNKHKKIDVYKNDKKVASIGDNYLTFIGDDLGSCTFSGTITCQK